MYSLLKLPYGPPRVLSSGAKHNTTVETHTTHMSLADLLNGDMDDDDDDDDDESYDSPAPTRRYNLRDRSSTPLTDQRTRRRPARYDDL